MKRFFTLLFAFLLCLAPALAEEPRIGVCFYNGADTFIASYLIQMEALSLGRATLIIRDAENDQNRQNDQIGALLAGGVDALIVNPVDRTSAVYLIQMAQKQDIPIVFINREPLESDLRLYDKAYYVGIDPKQQGQLSGQLAAQYFIKSPGADRNRDGVLQLVLLKGEPGHQDAELRTRYALKALFDQGIAVEVLAEDSALWQRSLGQEKMAAFLNAYGERIECVLSNNDDMALGAIDALKAAGYFAGDKHMPVLGIDATAPALEALQAGTLYGTVFNDAKAQASAAFELALALARLETAEEKVIYVQSQSVTLTSPLPQ